MSKTAIIILCIIGGIIGLAITITAIVVLYNTLNGKCDPTDPNEPVDYKPVIYLYPKEKIDITVRLGKPNNLTTTYPKYNNGWNIIANPDGTLIDKTTNRELYSLYWEGKHSENIEFNDGFIVKGNEVGEFLEEKLSILGLNDKESEEFIIYWLPILEKNEYNLIRFASIDEINKNMPLELSVKPDTIIRVLMECKKIDKEINIKEQTLQKQERNGFTVVEWGGTIVEE